MRVVVLASGRGSNLAALIAAQADADAGFTLVGVASDRPKAAALERARAAGIPTLALKPKDHPQRSAFDAALFDGIAAWQPDLIVLAGFMRILSPAVLTPWLGRMLNIHPSLLPKYPGLDTHARALAAGDIEHGASVHFVTAELDGGPVLGQARIGIEPDDTPESLANRLLPLEHRLLTACVKLLAHGRVRWSDAQVIFDGVPLGPPLQLDAEGRLARPE